MIIHLSYTSVSKFKKTNLIKNRQFIILITIFIFFLPHLSLFVIINLCSAILLDYYSGV